MKDRRTMRRRFDDERPVTWALFLGFAYGVVLTALVYAWLVPIVR